MASPSWSPCLSSGSKVKITGNADHRSHAVAPSHVHDRRSACHLTIRCEHIELLIHAMTAQHALDIESRLLKGQTLDELVPVSGAQLLQPPLDAPWPCIVGGQRENEVPAVRLG